MADADTFFGQELPAIQQWQLAREDARRITRPVLAVIGEKSLEVSPIWNERQPDGGRALIEGPEFSNETSRAIDHLQCTPWAAFDPKRAVAELGS